MKTKTDYVNIFWKRLVQITGWAFLLTLLQAVISWDYQVLLISIRFAIASFVIHQMMRFIEKVED